MEGKRLYSTLQSVSIHNFQDAIEVNLERLFDAAEGRQLPQSLSRSALAAGIDVDESVGFVKLTYDDPLVNERTVSIVNNPVEIVIDKPLDETSLGQMLAVAGSYKGNELVSDNKLKEVVKFIETHPEINRAEFHNTGLRIIFKIPENVFLPLYGLPMVFTRFAGRSGKIEDLIKHRECAELQNKASLQRISGISGIGKSQLANHYARLMFKEQRYSWVLWISAKSANTNSGYIWSQLLDYAEMLSIDTKKIKGPRLLHEIFTKLSKKGIGLIVFDDATDYASIKSFIPTNLGYSGMDILVTSTNSLKWDNNIIDVSLDIFDPDDSTQYIQQLLVTASKEEANELAVTLGHFPLTITQAVNCILENDLSIAVFCQRYREKQKARKVYLQTAVMDNDPYAAQTDDDLKSKASVWGVMNLTFEELKQSPYYDLAKRLLYSVSYLAPEKPLEKRLLLKFLKEKEDEIDLEQALILLKRRSLLDPSSCRGCYKIHGVVQDVMRVNDDESAYKSNLMDIHDKFMLYFNGIDFIRDIEPGYCALHMIALSEKYNEVLEFPYTDMNEKIEVKYKYVQLMSFLSLVLLLQAHYYFENNGLTVDSNLGHIIDMAADLERFVNISFLTGMNNNMQCFYKINLGIALSYQGKHATAVTILSDVVKTMREQKEDPLNLLEHSLFSLGICYIRKNQPKDAVNVLDEALKRYLGKYDDQCLKVVYCQTSLGVALVKSLQPEKGVGLLEKGIAVLKKSTDEPNDLGVGNALLFLGLGYLYLWEAKKASDSLTLAQAIFIQALEGHKIIRECRFYKVIADSSLPKLQDGRVAVDDIVAELDEFSEAGDESELLLLLMCVLEVLRLVSDPKARQSLSQTLFALCKTVKRVNVVMVGDMLGDLGLRLFHLGDLIHANKCYLEAFEIFNLHLGPDSQKSQLLSFSVNEYGKVLDEFFVKWKTEDPVNAIAQIVRAGTPEELKEALFFFGAYANLPDQIDLAGLTPLHSAVIGGRPEQSQLLLEHFGFIVTPDAKGVSALDYAIKMDEILILDQFKKALVKKYFEQKADINDLPRLVRICAYFGDEDGLKLLIHLATPINKQGLTEGQTALHIAVIRGHKGCISLLVEAGADLEVADAKEQTPEDLAQDKPEILELLHLNQGKVYQ